MSFRASSTYNLEAKIQGPLQIDSTHCIEHVAEFRERIS